MNKRTKLFVFLSELRKYVKYLGIGILCMSALLFAVSGSLIEFFQHHLDERLYFFSVAGPFLAHVKVSFFAALYLLMPCITYILWKAMGKPFGVEGKRLLWFTAATCALFYAGTLFCFLVTLPFGVRFLLGFQSEEMKALISIGRFVNFVTLFILAFGMIFELPVFMIFSAQVGVFTRKTFEKNRRFAVLGIAILAALLTPTPDLVNMALMGGPLYLLYEAGILLIRIFAIDRKAGDRLPQG